MKEILECVLKSVVIGVLTHFIQANISSSALTTFLQANLITMLVALLAINTTTSGIVLSTIRQSIDRESCNADSFAKTRNAMLESVCEQITLIVIAGAAMVVFGSQYLPLSVKLWSDAAYISIFAYSMYVLKDTANSIFLILDLR